MKNLKIVAVVGSKKSGKTTVVEALIEEFVRRGYNVAAVKHVSELAFTIDAAGKDTWRFGRAGAKTVVSVAATEIATIQKASFESLSLESVLQRVCESDIVFIEGLRGLVGARPDVPKIVTVKTLDEARTALETFRPIIAFSGICTAECLQLNLPYIDVLKHPAKLADFVEAYFQKVEA